MIPKRLKEEIETWINERKYGHLQINFAGGKIVNVNRVESIKVEFTLGAGGGTITTAGDIQVFGSTNVKIAE